MLQLGLKNPPKSEFVPSCRSPDVPRIFRSSFDDRGGGISVISPVPCRPFPSESPFQDVGVDEGRILEPSPSHITFA